MEAEDLEVCVLALVPKVKRLAHRVPLSRHRVLDRADLVSAGTVGLLEAMRTYQPAKGNLNTHVDRRIRGAIADAFRAVDELSRDARRRGMQNQQTLSLDGWTPMTARYSDGGTLEWEDTLKTQLVDDAPPLDTQAMRHQQYAALEQACAALPTRWRIALHYRYAQDLTFTEIGARLGMTETGAWYMHRDALKRLRKLLADWRTEEDR